MRAARFVFAVAAMCLALSAADSAQQARDTRAEVALQAAIKIETIDGDLKAAIEAFKNVVATYESNRPVAAKALVHIGQCYDKLGAAEVKEAQKAYERVVREFGDQVAETAAARARLAGLAGAAGAEGGSTMAVRRVWAGPKTDSMGRVSPDGRFVSFTDWDTGDLAIHDFATGQDRRITQKGPWATSNEYADLSIVSPDSRQIAYNWFNKDSSSDLRIVDIDGSKPRILRAAGDGVNDLYPKAWSLDGRQLLAEFWKTDGTRDMMLVTVTDGSTRLLKAMGKDRSPGGVFSPDGRYIAWDVREGPSLLEIETGREFLLVPDFTQHDVLGWTPDGKRLLFSSDRSGSTDVWLIAVADGKASGEPELVKKGFNGNTLGVTRGGALYYAVSNIVKDVLLAELDPTSGSVVAPPQPVSRRWVGITRNPDWSPDGRSLAYIRNPTPNDSVIVIRSTSTGEERDLHVGLRRVGLRLRWAPDGNAVVVPGLEDGTGWSLMRIDAQTGKATSLMPLSMTVGPYPRFDVSPDGKTIFYIKSPVVSDLSRFYVVVRDLQSGEETVLLEKTIFSVSVAPDGKQLVVGAQADGSQVVLVMPAAGGEVRELVRIDEKEADYRVWPSWTPDGRHVVFAKGLDGKTHRNVQVWRVAAEGGEPQRLGLTVQDLSSLRLHPDGRRVAIETWTGSVEVWAMENFLPKAAAAPTAKAK